MNIGMLLVEIFSFVTGCGFSTLLICTIIAIIMNHTETESIKDLYIHFTKTFVLLSALVMITTCVSIEIFGLMELLYLLSLNSFSDILINTKFLLLLKEFIFSFLVFLFAKVSYKKFSTKLSSYSIKDKE